MSESCLSRTEAQGWAQPSLPTSPPTCPERGPVSHSRSALFLPLSRSRGPASPQLCLHSAPSWTDQFPPPPLPGQGTYLGSPSMGSLALSAICPSALGLLHLLPGGDYELDIWPFSASLKCLEGKNHFGSISEVTIGPDTKQVLRSIHSFVSVIRIHSKQLLSPC